MGGFTLTGPSFVFTYVYESDERCMCRGLRANITQEQESQFLAKKGVVSVVDFHHILHDQYAKIHTYVGEEENKTKQMMRFNTVKRR